MIKDFSTDWFLVRDQSKFTGYLDRVLGKICLKKVFAPFFRKNTLIPPFNLLPKPSFCACGRRRSMTPDFFFEFHIRILKVICCRSKKKFVGLEMKTIIYCMYNTPMNTHHSLRPLIFFEKSLRPPFFSKRSLRPVMSSRDPSKRRSLS